MRTRIAVLMQFVAMIPSACTEAQTIVPIFPCSELLESPYGATSHITHKSWDYELRDSDIKTANYIGITNIRSDFEYVDPSKANNWFYKQTDSVYLSLKKGGMNLLPILSSPWKKHAWSDIDSFNKYVYNLLVHYGDSQKYWEVINEVNHTVKNNSHGAIGYAQTLANTYQVIKEYSPESTVLLGGLGEVTDGFLEKICEQGAYRYFDIMNFHSYYKPEDLPKFFNYVRGCMDKYGWEKPVWITEEGMHTAPPKGNPEKRTELEKEQAQRVARLYLISFAYGVDKVFWYNLRSFEKEEYEPEDHFGLTHKDLSPKPAFFAYKTMTSMCPSGSTRPSLAVEGTIYVSSWVRPDKKKVWAIWSSKEQKEIKVKTKGFAKYSDYMGNKIKKQKRALIISEGVTYIVGAKEITIE